MERSSNAIVSKERFSVTTVPKERWIEFSAFWEYSCGQRSRKWERVRCGRVSGSTVAASIGRSPYATPDDVAEEIFGGRTRKHDAEAIARMQRGILYEPVVRALYQRYTGLDVRERGFVVPKWDTKIGVSVDGEVLSDCEETIGIIEIKVPVRVYSEVRDACALTLAEERTIAGPEGTITVVDAGVVDWAWIRAEHYDQMQMGCAIMGAPWCDYLVYDEENARLYLQQVLADPEHWAEMHKGIEAFRRTKLPLYQKDVRIRDGDAR